jgi:molybdenum cofactor cytidylyltransferase
MLSHVDAASAAAGRGLRSGEATPMKRPPTVIVLAAGRGSRFKAPEHKLLQPFGATTVLGSTLEHAIESGLQVRVVTTAALSAEARRHVAQRDIIELPEATGRAGELLGMGYSIASGVAASADAGGWLVLPGDMPTVQPSSLLAVAATLPQHAVAYAQYRGRRGHPVGFSAEPRGGAFSIARRRGRGCRCAAGRRHQRRPGCIARHAQPARRRQTARLKRQGAPRATPPP